MTPVTLTPASAAAIRAMHDAGGPVSHKCLDARAIHRLVRDGRFVHYADMPISTGSRRMTPHYALTPAGERLALALPDVLPPHPFTVYAHKIAS
jgi:hypothetical protein